MNEIVGPIYYVLASDPREDWRGDLNKIKRHTIISQKY